MCTSFPLVMYNTPWELGDFAGSSQSLLYLHLGSGNVCTSFPLVMYNTPWELGDFAGSSQSLLYLHSENYTSFLLFVCITPWERGCGLSILVYLGSG